MESPNYKPFIITLLYKYYLLEIYLILIMQFAYFVRKSTTLKKQYTIVNNMLEDKKKLFFTSKALNGSLQCSYYPDI